MNILAVLLKPLIRIEPLTFEEAPQLYAIAEKAAKEIKIPMPDLYVLPTAAANVMIAGGFRSSLIIVTQGIFEVLNREEMFAVLSCAMGPIKRKCAGRGLMAAIILSVLTLFFTFSFRADREKRSKKRAVSFQRSQAIFDGLAKIIRKLGHFSIPLSCWIQSDETAGVITQNPLYLASALSKLEARSSDFGIRGMNPALAHLFIISPLDRCSVWKKAAAQPVLETRIARLIRDAILQGFNE